jgi:hypothetical protein
MSYESIVGDVLALLFFITGISLAWWVFRRPVRKMTSFVLGGISAVLLLLSGVLYFFVQFLLPHMGTLSDMH